MKNREDMLKEILSDKELMEKYNITNKLIENLKPYRPGSKKIVNILSTIINENDNERSARQIYTQIKNLHKI